MTTRIRATSIASAALLALSLGLAACADEAPQVDANEGSELTTEIAPPAPEQEQVTQPIEEPATAIDNVAEASANAVGVEEEPVSVDQQTLEDADATGMTSRYTEGEGVSAGNETAPAE